VVTKPKMPAATDFIGSNGGLSNSAVHFLGDVERYLSDLSKALDDAFGDTRGSIIYRGDTAWESLGPGTNGQFLKTNGAGADPSWATITQSYVFLSERLASGSTQLAFTSGITSTYSDYEFIFENIVPATDNTELSCQFSVDGGSNWINANYLGQGVTDRIPISSTASGISNSAGIGLFGRTLLYNPSGGNQKALAGPVSYFTAASAFGSLTAAGKNTTTSAVNAVRFFMQSGNIATGTIRMYGIKGS
jgi:hypothetical protein